MRKTLLLYSHYRIVTDVLSSLKKELLLTKSSKKSETSYFIFQNCYPLKNYDTLVERS